MTMTRTFSLFNLVVQTSEGKKTLHFKRKAEAERQIEILGQCGLIATLEVEKRTVEL